jgi:hypothetical protein
MKGKRGRAHRLPTVVLIASVIPVVLIADTVPVRYRVGSAHGFLTLRSMEGRLLATGEQVQTLHGGVVTKRLTFRFGDGSIDDETTTFADAPNIRLLTYHHVQKGPSFTHPLELMIDARTGHVTRRELNGSAERHTEDLTMALPEDLSNGLLTNVVENVASPALPLTVSYLAATPKLRLVNLVISSGGLDRLSDGTAAHEARHYVVDVHIGGLQGVMASAFRRSLPRSHIWISTGIPAFLRAEAPLDPDGPMWRIDLTEPRPPDR